MKMFYNVGNSLLFASDVTYKKCKRPVYTSPDLSARFCKVNLSNTKKSGLIFFLF